jgi:uncharacterized protein YggT (Ycf19 family)
MLLQGAAKRGKLGRRRAEMITGIPIWVIVLDYALGTIMWTLIGRSAMNVFLPINSDFFFMKFFVRVTDPLLRLFRPITPSFLVDLMVPLYVAWFFFIVRFYLMPWLLGYSVMGMLSFPLEGDIARFLYQTRK